MVQATNKIDKINIESPFDNILTVIDNNDYSYDELNMNQELDIVKERIGTTSKRQIDAPSSSSRMSTSRRIEYEIPNEIIPTQHPYYITGILNQRKYLILINTGEQDNWITRELITEDDIIIQEQGIPDLPIELKQTKEITIQELIIGGIPINIQFTIGQINPNIVLGLQWLEQVKPYKLEDKRLIIHYQNKNVIINRTKSIL